MGRVYARGGKLYLDFKDAHGGRQRVKTGLDVGEEKAAEKLLARVEAKIARGEHHGAAPQTVRAFADAWIQKRDEDGLWSADTNRHQLAHITDELGAMPMHEVKPRHIQAFVHHLRSKKSKRTGAKLAPRTIRGTYGTLHTMFEDAVAQEVIEANPCKLRKGQLPQKVDRDPTWRVDALFTRQESELLISHPSIPESRRVAYALMLLGGLRFGERAAVRWRHYDDTLQPLGRLMVAGAFNSQALKEKGTKTEQPRAVPVHRTLKKILASWRLTGWAEMVGHMPGPDDLIVPAYRAKRWTNETKGVSLTHLHEDLERLGLRRRRQHDMRRTFTSLARADGARADLLEMITHSPKGDMVSIYTTMPWPALCAEVEKLDIRLHEGQVVQMVATAGTRQAHREKINNDSGMLMAGALGFESSQNAQAGAVVHGPRTENRRVTKDPTRVEPGDPGQGCANCATPYSSPAIDDEGPVAEVITRFFREPQRRGGGR